MANEVVVQEKTKLPAHLMDLFKPEDNDDLKSGLSGGFGSLSIKGKEFAVSQGKEKQTIMTLENDEQVAARFVDVILIKSTKAVSKTYYEGEYVEGADVQPRCQSTGGIKPDASVEKPIYHICALCPMNKFGSGKNGTGKGCSDNKRMALAVVADPDKALLLRLSYTSMKPLEEYGRMLAKRGVPYQAVVTKLGFEQGVTHPQLTFKPSRFVTEEEAAVVKGHIESSVVEDILGMNTPVHEGVNNGTAGGTEVQETAKAPKATETKAAPVPAKAAPKPAPKPEPKPEADAFLIDEPTPVKSKPAEASKSKIVEAPLETKSGEDAELIKQLAEFDL